MTESDQQAGPSVDGLQDAFPMVDRDDLETIRESVDRLTYRAAADILDESARMGNVPDEDYQQLAAAASDSNQLDLDTQDPLDDPPDADPASPHNQKRGQRAMGRLRSTNYGERAREVAREGSISQMCDLISTIDKWGNEAMLDPNRATLPTPAKKPMETLADALVARIDALAAQGNVEALQDAKTQIAALHSEGFRKNLTRDIETKLNLVTSDGSDYEQVRQQIFGSEKSLGEVRRIQREAMRTKSITYEQAEELLEDINSWIEANAQAANGEATDA